MNELLDIIEQIKKFRDERDWKQFHTPKNLAISVAIESGELLECFQWVNENSTEFDLENISDELADVMIYLLLLADSFNIDMIEAVRTKIKKNAAKYPAEKCKGSNKKYTEYS